MPRQSRLIHVAVGVVIDQDQHILIAQRPAHKYKGGLWEFPGGKVEPGESAYEALQREFREEVGIEIISAIPWLKIEYLSSDRDVLLDTWLVKQFTGTPSGLEGQKICWVTADKLDQFTFPEGNKTILQHIKLGFIP